jgi:uncharacterized Tic20 family protein
MQTAETISAEERGLAVATHLSGLAGYIIPLGGIIVPIIIWIVKSESPVISSIAKQAIILNVAIFLLGGAFVLLCLTIILIPVSILAWIVLGIIAIALPIIGAIKASEGTYYRYPVVGVEPTA